MAKKTKYYAVAKGRNPGVYEDWRTCEEQVKGFRSAKFKSFPTRQEAEAFVRGEPNWGIARNADTATAAAVEREEIDFAATAAQGEANNNNNRKRKLEPPRESRHWLVRIYFDGGSRGNPGLAGSGAEVVFLENTTVAATTSTNRRQSSTPSSPSPIITQVLQERKKIHVSKYLGTNATNNQAEYHGVLAGLQRARNEILQLLSSEDGIRYLWTIDLEVRGDSELIIRQLQGDYKCRHAQLQPLFQQVMECVEDLKRRDDLQLNVTFDHIYREDNSTADALANDAMDMKLSRETIFYADGTLSNRPLNC